MRGAGEERSVEPVGAAVIVRICAWSFCVCCVLWREGYDHGYDEYIRSAQCPPQPPTPQPHLVRESWGA